MKIPSYSELTDTQRNIANLPPVKNYVVTGVPGTGKTVIALYMAKQFAEQGKRILFLVHNRPLKLFIESQLMDVSLKFEVNTFDSWIAKEYFHLCGARVPMVNFVYDWNVIVGNFHKIGKVYDYVIFDETQDFQKELIETVKTITSNVACFMDPDQSININTVSEDDLLEVLDVRSSYKLLDNFRNTKEIFDFAKIYAKNSEMVSAAPHGDKPAFIKVPSYAEQNAGILNVIRANSTVRTIGVITNPASAQITYDSICQNDTSKDVFLYKTKSREFRDLNFSKPGIYVLPYTCVKGLEFDVVILTRCEKIYLLKEGDTNNLFYVAVTRAKKRLYCFYFSTSSSNGFFDVFKPINDKTRSLIEWGFDWNLNRIK